MSTASAAPGPLPAIDTAALRQHFPALRYGVAHFDSPGGTQTPDRVAEAIHRAMMLPLSNASAARLTCSTGAERNADDIVTGCRAALGDLLGVDPATVVFGRSMTSLTFEMSRAVSQTWRPGDEVVISRLEHDANARPWVIAAQRCGATVRWAGFDRDTTELSVAAVEEQLSDRTVLIAVTAASNLLGTMPDIPAIAERAHRAGALLYVDGVHYAAHEFVDVPALGADLFACSPYKFLGPHCGVVTGRTEVLAGLRPDKLIPSSDAVPQRFELGTLPYELMAGTTAAIDFLADLAPQRGARRERLRLAMGAIAAHEDALRERIETALTGWAGVAVHSRAARRTPTLLATFADHRPGEVFEHLASHAINAPAGTFYAYEPARHLGIDPHGGLRIGFAPYNTHEEADRLIAALELLMDARGRE